MVGNQHATSMPIKDIALSSNATSDLSGGMTVLYVLDTNRKFAKAFAWMTEEDFYDQAGWYFGEEEEPTTYELAPGEVLQMQCSYQVKLEFPAQ